MHCTSVSILVVILHCVGSLCIISYNCIGIHNYLKKILTGLLRIIMSSILAWEIPWTEEPAQLQSMGSRTVRHDQATNTHKGLLNLVSLKSLENNTWFYILGSGSSIYFQVCLTFFLSSSSIRATLIYSVNETILTSQTQVWILH